MKERMNEGRKDEWRRLSWKKGNTAGRLPSSVGEV